LEALLIKKKVGRPSKRTAEVVVKNIRRQTRRKFGSEEKMSTILFDFKSIP
jgi:hypothetical protein